MDIANYVKYRRALTRDLLPRHKHPQSIVMLWASILNFAGATGQVPCDIDICTTTGACVNVLQAHLIRR